MDGIEPGVRLLRSMCGLGLNAALALPEIINATFLNQIWITMKKFLVLFLLSLLPSAYAGEAEIRQSLQSRLPDVGAVGLVSKTPYGGLYEVVIGDQLLYTDEQGQYLFEGRVIDVKRRCDITEG